MELEDGAVEKTDLQSRKVAARTPHYDNVKGENPFPSIIRSCW
jgi:hypothetical protein